MTIFRIPGLRYNSLENSSNGYYIAEWRDAFPPTSGPTIVHPTSLSSARDIANLVASEKYIFINP